jgi:hypothetical protein
MINLFIISIFILILLLGVYLYYQNNTQLENFQENCPAITFDTDNFYSSNTSTESLIDPKKYNSFQLNDFSDDHKKMICKFNAMRDALEDMSTKFNYQHYDVYHTLSINLLNNFNSNRDSNYFEVILNSFNDSQLFKLTYYKNKQILNVNNTKLLILKIDPSVDPTSSDQIIKLTGLGAVIDGLSPRIDIVVSTTKKRGVYTNRLTINLIYRGSSKSYCYLLPATFQNHFYKNLKNISVVSATNCPFSLTSTLNKNIYTEYEPPKIIASKVNATIIGADNWTGGVKVRNAVIQRGFLNGFSPLCETCDGNYTKRKVLMVKPNGKYVIPAERISFVWSNQGGRDSGSAGKVMMYKVENESKVVQEIDPVTNQLVNKTYNYKALGDFSIIIPIGSRPNIQGVARNTGDDGNYDPWQRTLRIDGKIEPNGNASLSNLPVLIREDCLQSYEINNLMIWWDRGSRAWRDGASWTTTNTDNPLKDEPGFPGINCANYKGDWGGAPSYINDRKYIIKKECLNKSRKVDIDIKDFDKSVDDLTNNNLKNMNITIDNFEKTGLSSITQTQNQISSDITKTNNEIGLSKNLYNSTLKNNDIIAQEINSVQTYYKFLAGTNNAPGFNRQLNIIKNKINELKNEKNNKLTKAQIDSLSNQNAAIKEGTKSQEYVDQTKNFDDQLNIYKSMSIFQTLLPERKQFSIQY